MEDNKIKRKKKREDRNEDKSVSGSISPYNRAKAKREWLDQLDEFDDLPTNLPL